MPVAFACPSGSIGHIKLIKDGLIVSGPNASKTVRNGILTAKFSNASGRAVMALDLDTFRVRALDGYVVIHRGTYCAYPQR